MEREIAVSIEQINITEQISYIKASDNPLSADVILMDGQEYLYVFELLHKKVKKLSLEQ